MSQSSVPPSASPWKWCRLALWSLALLLAGIFGLWSLSNARCFAVVGPPLCRVTTEKPLVALTFDDGPTEAGLRSVLPVLSRYGAKATFFLIGQEIEQRPSPARLLVANGQEIANHSYSHRRMILKPRDFYDREIVKTDVLIRAVGGSPACSGHLLARS